MILVLVVARSIGDPLEPVYEKAGQGFGLSRVHVSNYDWTEEKPNILVLSKHILGQPPYQKKTSTVLFCGGFRGPGLGFGLGPTSNF